MNTRDPYSYLDGKARFPFEFDPAPSEDAYAYLDFSNVPVDDPVSRPYHYARYVIEPATFIAANKLPFDVGNVIKYALRFDAKNGAEDVRKARRYCDMILERLDRERRVAAGESAPHVWKDCL